jgi:tripartite-type tricarboxylate transporter receptor subunit TctC
VVAPAGTPPALVTRLNALINEGLAGAEVTAALAKLYALPKTGAPADFSAFLELPKWTQAVKLSGRRLIDRAEQTALPRKP